MKKLGILLAMVTCLSFFSVGATNYWNGDVNYPEVAYTANGPYTYYFDQASLFKGIDSSRNFVFGLNVVTMTNNQYGSAVLYKYVVIPGMNIVCRYDANGKPYQIDPGTGEWNIFTQAWKLAYGVDFR